MSPARGKWELPELKRQVGLQVEAWRPSEILIEDRACGQSLIPEGVPWLLDLEDELASFPGGLHDDQVDAVTQALNRLRNSSGEVGIGSLLQIQGPALRPGF